MKLYLLLFCWVLIIYQFSVVTGKCCGGNWNCVKCSTYCAGCGPCNIFCCNCENGCNREWHHSWDHTEKGLTCGHWNKKRELAQNSKNASLEADKFFREVDTDDSRNISINETKQFLASKMQFKRRASFEEEFAKVDKNNDGMISPFEFDELLEN